MSHRLEFYFDCSSPWTYLAFEYSQRQLDGLDVEVEWKPILVGGIFNTVNPSVYQFREKPVPAKDAYFKKDLQDWARFVGLEIGMPPVFPVNSVKAMRGAFVAIEQDVLVPYARAVFKRYWTDLADISQVEELATIVEAVGLDRDDFFDRISSQPYKDKLKTNTDELIERGGYGTPTLFLNGDDMYFGNDRIDLMCSRIR
ncbi:MAG: 2-hydroxychromene-2-carboxylate isomerase [Gammaproteobacteria bacterium]|nr:2-hydroxychromene-2-carboxylate isomerase [Gammaproteobacteria bacterium]